MSNAQFQTGVKIIADIVLESWRIREKYVEPLYGRRETVERAIANVASLLGPTERLVAHELVMNILDFNSTNSKDWATKVHNIV